MTITPRLRDRWIERWRRQNERGDYQPFLRTEHVPSLGNKGRVKGHRSGRIHHLMSYNELLALVWLDRQPTTAQIREQYPLLPVEKTVAIARELGVKHPRYPRSRTLAVLTTDFLVHEAGGGRCAYSVKPARALNRRRTREKGAIEAGFWLLAGVPWKVLTDEQLRTTEHQNLLELHPYGTLEPELLLLESEWLKVFPVTLSERPGSRACECIEQAALRLGCAYHAAVALFYHGLWRGGHRGGPHPPPAP